MMWHRRHRQRPPWWPANESWPPMEARIWRPGHRRARFVRGIAVIFGTLLLLSALGAATLLSMLFGGRGLGGTSIQTVVAVVVMLGLLVFTLRSLMRRVGAPLGDIVEAANRVADGDYSARIQEHGPPTVRVVETAFNTMAAKLETQDRQRRHLMADIAHELRTPLSVIQGRLEGLLDGVYPRDDSSINEAIEETRTLARLVDDVRTLANAESGMLTLQKEPTDVAVLAQDAINSLSADARRRDVSLRLDAEADLPLVPIDPLRIREVFTNLLANAIQHTPPGGVVTILINGSDERIVVGVTDTGAGIAPEDLSKIFERFYKGLTSRGSGLGLTIARNLVLAHGGEIRAESQLGGGTTVTFTLPTG